MDPKLTSKELCCTLIDALTLGLAHDCIEDADTVLAALRTMRPRLIEFDTFEAWICMKRGVFDDAIRLLRNTVASPHGGRQATALMAYCQFAAGDARWSDVASQVLESDGDVDSTRLMRLLIDPASVSRDDEAAATAREPAVAANAFSPDYLRA